MNEQETRRQMRREQLAHTVLLGDDVAAFLKSPLGEFIDQRMASERAQAIEALLEVPCTEPLQIAYQQNKVWRVDQMRRWFQEAVIDGYNAINVLEGREDDPIEGD